MYVSAPRTVKELRDSEREYSTAGFLGSLVAPMQSNPYSSGEGLNVDGPSAPWPQVESDNADVQFDLQSL
jgi:hypothetical protein